MPGRRSRLSTGLRLLGGCLALCWQGACGGPTQFDITQIVAEQRLTAGAAGSALTTMLPTPFVLGLDIQQQATMHNAQGPVTTVELTSMALETTVAGSTSSSNIPFDFLKSATIYIESTRANSSLARSQVAVQATPPGRVTGFNLNTDPSVNLLPFLQEGARLVSTATGTLPTQDVTFTGSITLHVNTVL